MFDVTLSRKDYRVVSRHVCNEKALTSASSHGIRSDQRARDHWHSSGNALLHYKVVKRWFGWEVRES